MEQFNVKIAWESNQPIQEISFFTNIENDRLQLSYPIFESAISLTSNNIIVLLDNITRKQSCELSFGTLYYNNILDYHLLAQGGKYVAFFTNIFIEILRLSLFEITLNKVCNNKDKLNLRDSHNPGDNAAIRVEASISDIDINKNGSVDNVPTQNSFVGDWHSVFKL